MEINSNIFITKYVKKTKNKTDEIFEKVRRSIHIAYCKPDMRYEHKLLLI